MTKRSEKTRPEEFVEGWTFRLPLPAFLGALDISRVERKQTKKNAQGEKVQSVRWAWTQGNPPVFSFAVGDMFYSPNRELAIWGEQETWLQRSAQVRAVGAEGVDVRLTYYPSKRQRQISMSQFDFAAFLKTGVEP